MKMAHTPTTENLTRLRKPTTLVLDFSLANCCTLGKYAYEFFFPQTQGVLDAGRVWAVDAIFSIVSFSNAASFSYPL